MNWLRLFSISILFIFTQSATAEVFTVTTTAATGPGSLKEAIELAAANGDRETDFIYFNITRARDFFIRIPLNDLLPALTSNLVIDGTSQPGSAFGVTDARIGIALEGSYSGTNMLYALDGRQASDVKIYGLFLKANVIDRSTFQPPDQLYGILLGGSTNFVIGEPGKGNLVSGWAKGVYDISNNRWGASARINIHSNIFGLDIDGVSTTYLDRTGGTATNQYSIVLEKSTSTNMVGGNSTNEGNIFNSSAADVVVQGMVLNDGLVSIANNRFGIDINGDNIPSSSGPAILVYDINTFPANPFLPATPVINNNYIGGRTRASGIVATNVRTNFQINDNTLGYEDRSGFPPRDGNYGVGIIIRNSEQAMIRNNTIRYWKNGAILMDTTYSITITNNSTYCNRKEAIVLNHWNVLNPPQRPYPFVYINEISVFRSNVKGKAVPRSKVELFYNENCPNCEGKTWIATVNADLNGDWQYSGAITGDNIIATATDVGGATSVYSLPAIDTSSLNISPVSCSGSLGSICGLKILSGTKWYWTDPNNNLLGYDTCLMQVPPGIYLLKLSIGSSCEKTFSFIVRDGRPSIDITNVDIKPARCNGSNGVICGLDVREVTSISWEDEFGTVVSTKLCFVNASPGKYRLRARGLQNCEVVSPFFEIDDLSPEIDETNVQLIQPSCGGNNGSISGLQLFDTYFASMGWFDENGIKAGTGKDLLNVPPGRYKFVLKDVNGGCGDSTPYYLLTRIPGMEINTSNLQVVNGSCGNNNGSITGISISNAVGTVNYQWVNVSGSIVASTPDLLNVPAGNYQLRLKDGSNCDTLISPIYTIVDQGSIQINPSAVKITPAGCSKSNGAITGISVSGATSFEWRELNTNNIVSTSANLENATSGRYQLRAHNNIYGCSASSVVYEVPAASPLRVDLISERVQDASCGQNNGSIQLNIANASVFAFKWLMDSIASIGTNLSISGLAPATYYCIATDTNGCVQSFYRKKILASPLPVLNESTVSIKADTCELGTGSIIGLEAISDMTGIKYEWTDDNGRVVGNQRQLLNMEAGGYRLKVVDARGCVVTSRRYEIPTINITLPSPVYRLNKLEIPRHADATLAIHQSRPGTYELSDVVTGAILQQNNSGDFILKNIASDQLLQVIYISGPCRSAGTQISIKVFDDTRLIIPNAFSPNSDGINDKFVIKVEGYFRVSYLKIFNRWGQIVFENRDLNLGWDGRKNGAVLPFGTYYWILEGIDVQNRPLKRSGSVTLLR